MDYKEKYNYWLEKDYFDEETKLELKGIIDDKEIEDRFHTDLTFGTAGLRGKIGAGTNRMNKYTVSLASQGLAQTIVNKGKGAMDRGVAIAYDVRHYSDKFAEIAARVLAANGVKVYLFEGIRPTPVLSYAVRKLNTISGIVITASHNPKDYNGYKVYWEEGSQILDDIAGEIVDEINKIKDFSEIDLIDLDKAIQDGLIEYIGKEVDDSYEKELLELKLNDDIDKDIKIIYTPLNGTGNIPVRRILKKRGFTNIIVVPEQENPDPNFTTVGYPNPEDVKAFDYAKELGKKEDADIIIATDPDCDRVAMMVKDRYGEFQPINGNQTGALLVNYILSQRHKKGDIPPNGAIVKSIVTGDLSKAIAKKYNVETIETLTGFKNICGKANEFDKTGEYTFIFGYEESIGYVYGTMVRDKDGVNTSMLIAEMAGYYKKKGKSILDVLEDIYHEHGYYEDRLMSIVLEGLEGSKRISRIMEQFRRSPIMEFGDMKVIKIIDYLLDETGNPKSNVLKYYLDDGSWYAIRPSGTEPKIKLYIYSKDKSSEISKRKTEIIEGNVINVMNSIE
ncbi:phosphoglucomutase [Tissierella praeacuta DSM 18095]|uniref:Phosphoglucomutase n=1 Tax=Tissierella praeacuta DSM 18095 TaxID=1123404 RepID=A0A1M4V2Z5_9FIRM|nr:phospho-sugar mutase [Tissierella praeacuta]SHE63258.1 phosphoglucomutase [Tissierella praeacuta DSM 18095]SUP02839.1 Phosphoglucomutase [Tissierella praeacuta]